LGIWGERGMVSRGGTLGEERQGFLKGEKREGGGGIKKKGGRYGGDVEKNDSWEVEKK